MKITISVQRWAAPTVSRSRSAPAHDNYQALHSSSAPYFEVYLRLRSKLFILLENSLRLHSSSTTDRKRSTPAPLQLLYRKAIFWLLKVILCLLNFILYFDKYGIQGVTKTWYFLCFASNTNHTIKYFLPNQSASRTGSIGTNYRNFWKSCLDKKLKTLFGEYCTCLQKLILFKSKKRVSFFNKLFFTISYASKYIHMMHYEKLCLQIIFSNV